MVGKRDRKKGSDLPMEPMTTVSVSSSSGEYFPFLLRSRLYYLDDCSILFSLPPLIQFRAPPRPKKYYLHNPSVDSAPQQYSSSFPPSPSQSAQSSHAEPVQQEGAQERQHPRPHYQREGHHRGQYPVRGKHAQFPPGRRPPNLSTNLPRSRDPSQQRGWFPPSTTSPRVAPESTAGAPIVPSTSPSPLLQLLSEIVPSTLSSSSLSPSSSPFAAPSEQLAKGVPAPRVIYLSKDSSTSSQDARYSQGSFQNGSHADSSSVSRHTDSSGTLEQFSHREISSAPRHTHSPLPHPSPARRSSAPAPFFSAQEQPESPLPEEKTPQEKKKKKAPQLDEDAEAMMLAMGGPDSVIVTSHGTLQQKKKKKKKSKKQNGDGGITPEEVSERVHGVRRVDGA